MTSWVLMIFLFFPQVVVVPGYSSEQVCWASARELKRSHPWYRDAIGWRCVEVK